MELADPELEHAGVARQRAGVSTASAELLLSRIRAKLEDLCREREVPHDAPRTQLVEGDPNDHAAFALGSDSAVSIARI
jgi:hypothetical protein